MSNRSIYDISRVPLPPHQANTRTVLSAVHSNFKFKGLGEKSPSHADKVNVVWFLVFSSSWSIQSQRIIPACASVAMKWIYYCLWIQQRTRTIPIYNTHLSHRMDCGVHHWEIFFHDQKYLVSHESNKLVATKVF